MANTVFIPGAGASHESGAPLMSDFLDISRGLWSTGEVKEAEESFRDVFRAIGALQSVFAKSQIDINNVESVFAAFEMAKMIGKLGGYPRRKVRALDDAMKSVIVHTIRKKVTVPVHGGHREPDRHFKEFAQLVAELGRDGSRKRTVALITFNYDVLVDFALAHKGLNVDYALESGPLLGAFSLLKLHGSLNWAVLKRGKQRKVHPIPFRGFLEDYPLPESTEKADLSFWPLTDHRPEDWEVVSPYPFIVPPTWNKTYYHAKLSGVWKRAAQELAEAENVFIIGYSLPPTDMFFRYLYALGTASPTILERFWVFDPDPMETVCKRFRALLGGAAEQRFKHFALKFSEAVPQLRRELGV